ncbi:hypothetical protein [Bacillus sp. EE-W1]|uniref:hypothetical protein n=1 Tax=Bacillus sp. EE-W1 TaxID=2662453 RepID=UPI0012F90F95|nr:hypothetical protein [Bacillus sp. EE-W1]
MTNYGKLNDMFAIQYEFDQRIIHERNIEKTMDEWVIATTVAMEDMINRVGKVLYQVIKDNPNLLGVIK